MPHDDNGSAPTAVPQLSTPSLDEANVLLAITGHVALECDAPPHVNFLFDDTAENRTALEKVRARKSKIEPLELFQLRRELRAKMEEVREAARAAAEAALTDEQRLERAWLAQQEFNRRRAAESVNPLLQERRRVQIEGERRQLAARLDATRRGQAGRQFRRPDYPGQGVPVEELYRVRREESEE